MDLSGFERYREFDKEYTPQKNDVEVSHLMFVRVFI